MPTSLMSHAAFDRRLAAIAPPQADPDVTLDLSGASFVRPSGIAHLLAITFTLSRAGYNVAVTRPRNISVDLYLQRTDFWGLLRRQGLPMPEELAGYNIGAAAGLIECTEIPTTDGTTENLRRTELLYDRFIAALKQANVDWRRSARVWLELCGNAAEHSLAPASGAFVVAQSYRQAEIEIAIVDIGRGIHSALAHLGYADDMAAVAAALEERISGRRDPAGNPMDGGFGLPSARYEASSLFIRSGTALYEDFGERDDDKHLVMRGKACMPLLGTLVVAQVRA